MAPPRFRERIVLLLVYLSLVAFPSVVTAQPTTDPRVVEFERSPDHDRFVNGVALVDRYALEFYASGTNLLLQHIDVGKPTPGANGLIRFEFATHLGAWQVLGVTYEARVVALGPGGSTTSGNSNQFNFSTTAQPAPSPGGATCTYTVSPTSQSFNPAGGTATVTVIAPSGCGWTATRAGSWITILSGASSSGIGSVSYRVSANSGSTRRTGTLTIGGQSVTIVQSAATAPNAPAGLRIVVVR